MKTYQVYGTVRGSKYLGEVEAETAQEALERAPHEASLFDVRLCHQCSGECEDPEIDGYLVEGSDDLDDSAKEDGFWESKAYKYLARVRELEQHMVRAVLNARNEALEEAAKAIEDSIPESVDPKLPQPESAPHAREKILRCAKIVRSLMRETE